MKFSILAVTIASSVYAQTLEQANEFADGYIGASQEMLNEQVGTGHYQQENALEVGYNAGVPESQLEHVYNHGSTENAMELANMVVVDEAAEELLEMNGAGEVTFGIFVGLGVLLVN